jgi:hypothetical protein
MMLCLRVLNLRVVALLKAARLRAARQQAVLRVSEPACHYERFVLLVLF